jgi:hypothetical protein
MMDYEENGMKWIVMRLIGPVQPIGSHGEDITRCRNLQQLIELMDDLFGEINACAASENRPEASMNAIGKLAADYVRRVRNAE